MIHFFTSSVETRWPSTWDFSSPRMRGSSTSTVTRRIFSASPRRTAQVVQRVALGQDLVEKRLEPFLLRHHRARAALRLEGEVEVLELLTGRAGLELLLQLVELALERRVLLAVLLDHLQVLGFAA